MVVASSSSRLSTEYLGDIQASPYDLAYSYLEVDAITIGEASTRDCKDPKEYMKKFWDTSLSIASFQLNPLIEQIETFLFWAT